MNEFGSFIRSLRGKRSLREVSEIAGISHTYLSDLEKGIRRGSKTPVKPSPVTIKGLSKALSFSYEELMQKAGYLDRSIQETTPSDEAQELLNKFLSLPKEK